MDNFDLKKYLAEGRLFEEIKLIRPSDNIVILKGESGEYDGFIEDGEVSFSTTYDDLDYRITDEYDESNIEDFLGRAHAFVELAKKYDHDWNIERDLVGITIKLKDLAEGSLLKEEIKFIDYLTVDQDEFKAQYDKHYDDYGNDEDFVEEFGQDFLSPNIEKINKYYGRKLSKYDVGELLTDFYEGDGFEFISSNEKFEKWLDRNKEFYLG